MNVLSLKELRVWRGLSQKAVAEAMGHGEDYVSKLENRPIDELSRWLIQEYAVACGYEVAG